jgi:hypothetical protein
MQLEVLFNLNRCVRSPTGIVIRIEATRKIRGAGRLTSQTAERMWRKSKAGVFREAAERQSTVPDLEFGKFVISMIQSA